MSSLLKSTDRAGLVRANNIADFRVSSRSDNVPFSPKPRRYLRTTPTSQTVVYLGSGVSHYKYLGASL